MLNSIQNLLTGIIIDSEMPLYGIPYSGTSGAFHHVEDGAESGSA